MTNENWGLKPVLFYIGEFPVEAYPVFMFLALMTGLIAYMIQLRLDHIEKSNALYIGIFAIFGGFVGSKLPIIFIYWDQINSNPESMSILLSGRTIVGGLIGGFLGTFLAKKLFKIKVRLGNQIAIPVALGMAVGRIGCLLQGCCYGQPTNLPWGIDLGDHIFRHPTQVYEIVFDVFLVFFLIWRKKAGVEPGELFKWFMNAYLGFRFLLEFIRVENVGLLGFTDFQWLCMVSLVYINRHYILNLFKREGVHDL